MAVQCTILCLCYNDTFDNCRWTLCHLHNNLLLSRACTPGDKLILVHIPKVNYLNRFVRWDTASHDNPQRMHLQNRDWNLLLDPINYHMFQCHKPICMACIPNKQDHIALLRMTEMKNLRFCCGNFCIFITIKRDTYDKNRVSAIVLVLLSLYKREHMRRWPYKDIHNHLLDHMHTNQICIVLRIYLHLPPNGK